MKEIKSGITILLNNASNCTFIAHDLEASIPGYLTRPNDKHIEWCGELDIPVVEKEYREIAEALWQLLDDIDSASDMFKPSENNGIDSYKGFYEYVMKKQNERHELLVCDDANNLAIHPTYPQSKRVKK